MRQNPLMLPPEAGFEPAEMPGLRKAAILMVAIGDELAKTLFQSLSETRRAASDGRDYAAGGCSGNAVDAGVDGVLRVAGDAAIYGARRSGLCDEAVDRGIRRRKRRGNAAQVKKIRERTSGDMAKLQDMDPQHLSKFLENEHSQTVALVLAHLDAKRASVVLMNLQGAMRVDVVRRLAEMRQFSPEMAQTVAMALHKRMEKMGSSGRKSYSGFKAVAELLNRLNQTESQGILEEIEQSEPTVAIGIRELMFVFEDLVTVPAESIREFVSAADKKTLALALKGGKENVRAHLFKAMSSRAVEMLKEDMEVMGPVRMRDVGLAQQELLALARQLESEGKMILKMEVDDDLTV